MLTTPQCPCGGDPFAPEHGLHPAHLDWVGADVPESEAGFMAAVVTAARYLGWRVYHTYDSRRSSSGFPDLVLVKDRVLYREVKTDRGKVTPEQTAWIEALRVAGVDAGVWRPADWDRIEEELSK